MLNKKKRIESTMAEIEHNMIFEKRPGTDNHGGDYERNLTAFYAIKLALDDDVQNSRMASNVNNYGAFDDIVARVEYKNGTTKLYALQLKHKENPQQPISFINKAKGDFSLEKYKNSFHKDIKSGIFVRDRDYLSEGVELENVVSCLITNATMPKDTDNIFLDKRASLSCKALRSPETDFIGTTSEGYHIFEMHTQRPEFVPFLISRLFSGYQKGYDDAIKRIADQSNAIKKIGDRFKNELKTRIRTDEINFNDMLAGINTSMKESFKQLSPDLLEKTLKEVSDYFRAEYQTAEEVYQQHPSTCAEYSEFFQNFRFYGGQLKNKDVIEAIASRIEKSFGKPRSNVAKKIIKFVRDYFKNGRLLTSQQIKKKLLKLMLPSKLSMEELEDRFRVFQSVTNLNDPEQKLWVSKYIKVTVQGKEEIGLLDVVDPGFCQQLDPEFLFKHMGGVIQAGKKFEFKCENYIKRTFHKMYWCAEHFQSIGSQAVRSESDAFILSISEEDKRSSSILHELKYIDLRIRKYLPRDVFESCGNHILISDESDADERAQAIIKSCTAEVESFHYLKGPSLEWKGSRSKTAFDNRRNIYAQSFCEAVAHKWKCLKEQDLHDFISLVNIITGSPDMGKSTLLDSLIRYCPSNKWVLKLNLKECESDLRDKPREILNDPVQYIYNKSRQNYNYNEFSNLLFRHMKNKNAVTVFIDDFDKIRIDDDVVLRLIAKLEQLEIRTWVFMLPSVKKDRLEKKFNVKAIQITSLGIYEITDYLQKNIEKDELILRSFFKEIINIANQPLNLTIVSDILSKNNLDNFQVTDLYEEFINKKCEMFSKEFAGIDLIQNHQILSLLRNYKLPFLIENDIMSADYIKKFLKDTKRYISVIGLISKISRSIPIFSHTVVGDYLTAKWLSSNTNHKAFKSMYQRLFEQDLTDVRFFFNKIVVPREYPLHAAIVDGNLKLLKFLSNDIKSELNLCDRLSRNALHLAMSYFKYKYTHLLFSENVSYSKYDYRKLFKETELPCKIANEICKRSSHIAIKKKDCFGWSPKNYAQMIMGVDLMLRISCYWGCSALTSMCLSEEKNKFWNRTRNIKSNLNKALLCAYKRGHLECVKLLLQQELKNTGISKSDKKNIWIHFINMNVNVEEQSFNLLMFFIINEKPFTINTLLKFGHKFGYFYDLPRFPLTDDMEKELIQSCKHNFESLEEYFRLTNISYKQLSIEDREDIVIKMMLSGCTPLYAAVWGNHINAVMVLANLCNINEISRDKFIPFHSAVRKGNIDLIKLLIKAGANVNQVDSDGNTPIHNFYKNCKPSTRNTFQDDFDENSMQNVNVTVLFADIKALYMLLFDEQTRDQIKDSEKYFEYFCNRVEVMELLISNGADPTIKNSKGSSCFGLAIQAEIWKIIELFVEGGFDIDYRDCDEDYPALHKASEVGRFYYTEYFLNKGANPNIQVSGRTCLDLALNTKVIIWETVKLLMEINADLNYMQSTKALAPLINAVEDNQLEISQYLVRKQSSTWNELDFNSCFEWQTTKQEVRNYILELFIENEKHKDAALLSSAIDVDFLNHTLHNEIDLTAKLFDGKSYFGRAVEGQHCKIVGLFIEKGVPVDYRDYYDGHTALHEAIKTDEHEHVKYFLNKGANINITTVARTSLDLALSNEKVNWKTVKLLVENGADVNNSRQNERGYSPLHYAVEQNHYDMVHYLINKHADLSVKDDLCELTPLELAYQLRRLNYLTPENRACNLIVLMLLTNKKAKDEIQWSSIPTCALDFINLTIDEEINVTEINYKGISCFGAAIKYCCWVFVKQFVGNGVSINYRDNYTSFTALHKAIIAGQFEHVMFFLNKRADVNIKINEKTSLDLALQNKPISWETVKMLVDKGVDVNCNQNDKGFSPLHYAVEENRLDMVKYLVNKQADFLLRDGLAKKTPLEFASELKRINIEGFLTLKEVQHRANLRPKSL